MIWSRSRDVLGDILTTARASPSRSAIAVLGALLSVGMLVWAVVLSATAARGVDDSFAALDARRLLVQLPVEGSAWPGIPAEVVDAAGRLPGALSSAIVLERPAHLTTLRAPHLDLDVTSTLYSWDGDPGALGADVAPQRDGLLVGAALASREHLGVGTRLEAGGSPYSVTGVTSEWDALPDVLLGVVRHQPGLSAADTDEGMLAVAVQAGQADAVAERLRSLISPDRPSSVFIRYPPSPDALRAQVGDRVDGLVLVAALGLLLVSAAGVGIATFARVLDQRRLLGLRRAIGASRAEVALSIVLETGVLAGLGAAIGALAGLGVAMVQLAGQVVVVPWFVLVLSVLAAIAVNAAAAVIPGVLAVRTPPAEAIRPR